MEPELGPKRTGVGEKETPMNSLVYLSSFKMSLELLPYSRVSRKVVTETADFPTTTGERRNCPKNNTTPTHHRVVKEGDGKEDESK